MPIFTTAGKSDFEKDVLQLMCEETKNILLIIDMQKGFINDDLEELVRKIKHHIEDRGSEYYKIIFTKYVNDGINTNFKNRLNYTGMCGGEDLEIVDELRDLSKSCLVCTKNTYSALKNDVLRELVTSNRVNLHICGVDFDACILATAFEAFDLGLEFTLLKNLIGTSATNKNMDLISLVKRNIGG